MSGTRNESGVSIGSEVVPTGEEAEQLDPNDPNNLSWDQVEQLLMNKLSECRTRLGDADVGQFVLTLRTEGNAQSECDFVWELQISCLPYREDHITGSDLDYVIYIAVNRVHEMRGRIPKKLEYQPVI